MIKYTDQELLHMLEDLESDRVERKESFSGDVSKKAREAICAFANDLPNIMLRGFFLLVYGTMASLREYPSPTSCCLPSPA